MVPRILVLEHSKFNLFRHVIITESVGCQPNRSEFSSSFLCIHAFRLEYWYIILRVPLFANDNEDILIRLVQFCLYGELGFFLAVVVLPLFAHDGDFSCFALFLSQECALQLLVGRCANDSKNELE